MVKFSIDLHLSKAHIFDRIVLHINNVWYTAHLIESHQIDSAENILWEISV